MGTPGPSAPTGTPGKMAKKEGSELTFPTDTPMMQLHNMQLTQRLRTALTQLETKSCTEKGKRGRDEVKNHILGTVTHTVGGVSPIRGEGQAPHWVGYAAPGR